MWRNLPRSAPVVTGDLSLSIRSKGDVMLLGKTLGGCAAALAFTGLAWGLAQQSEPSEPAEKPDYHELLQKELPNLEARRERIEAELETLEREPKPEGHWANEWAGSYCEGDGLGMNVRIKIAPDAGVTYTWHGCLGLYDGNHGDIVRVFDDGVEVDLAIDPALGGYRSIDTRLYFVRWGDQRFLVPKANMLELVNNYNVGGYQRTSMFRIARKDGTNRRFTADEARVAGRPELPPEYTKLIIEEPLSLVILSVKAVEQEKELPFAVVLGDIEFEGGSDRGVYVGLEFPIETGRHYGTVEITSVDDTTCEGRYTGYGAAGEAPSLPVVGARLRFPGAAN